MIGLYGKKKANDNLIVEWNYSTINDYIILFESLLWLYPTEINRSLLVKLPPYTAYNYKMDSF